MALTDAEKQKNYRDRERGKLERLRGAAAANGNVTKETAALRARIHDLETWLKNSHAHGLVLEELLRKKQERAAKPSPDPDDVIARLKTTNKNLLAKLNETERHHRIELARLAMSPSAFRAIVKCLHPDYAPSNKQRAEACGLLTQWKQAQGRR